MTIDLSRLSLASTEPEDFEPGPPRAKWSLTRLADHYGSDKGNIRHRYTPRYGELLEHLRAEPVRLLEVGVACGASLKMWSAWFKRGQVLGVDVNPKCAALCKGYGRISIRVADARTEEIGGEFDVVIDDASHIPVDMVAIWRNTWRNVRPGGFYFVEDLHCVGWDYYRKQNPARPETDFDPAPFRDWIDSLRDVPEVAEVRNFGKLLMVRKR